MKQPRVQSEVKRATELLSYYFTELNIYIMHSTLLHRQIENIKVLSQVRNDNKILNNSPFAVAGGMG